MISTQHNCIFIHIPKCAGQSIERYFIKLLGITWKQKSLLLMRYNADPSLGPRRLSHLTASEYVDCGHVSKDAFQSFYKFAFVRNPWDRIVSEFEYRRHTMRFDFKSFIFQKFPPAGPTDPYRHILPQYCFLFGEKGDRLVDFIGRFEDLQEDFSKVCRFLKIPDTGLRHCNRSCRQKSYVEYFDTETKDFVADYYREDIRRFNYFFGQ